MVRRSRVSAPTPLEHLFDLTRKGRVDELRRMVTRGDVPADLWRTPLNGDPLLVVAVTQDSLEVLTVLLAVGDPGATTGFGDTPLMIAALWGKPTFVEALLPVSDPNVQNRAGQTALGLAVENASENDWAVRLDPSKDDSIQGRIACARLLIPVTDLSLTERQGLTVLDLSRTFRAPTCEALLIAHLAASPSPVGTVPLMAGRSGEAADLTTVMPTPPSGTTTPGPSRRPRR